MDPAAVQKKAKANFASEFIPSPIKRGLGIEEVSILEEQGDAYPGITYSVESVRRYPVDASVESFIGYIGEVSPEEISADPDKGYRPGMLVGRRDRESL